MSPRGVHPIVFLVLILPFGAMSGYLTVALAYLLTHAGVPLAGVAGVIGISYIPHTWKFAWAPIVDTTLTRKGWYLIGGLASAAGIWASGALPQDLAHLPLLSAVTLISNFAVTLLGMSVESLMAYTTSEDQKGRAGGWFQAGNLGGQGVGGGAALWLAQHLPAAWMAGASLAVACALCAAALALLPEPPSSLRRESVRRGTLEVGRDLWTLARSRSGFLALVLCLLPIGSGAAMNLWSAISGDWHASAETVELATGVVGGVMSAIGCVAGGWVCDRMDRKGAYMLYGALQAACAVGMAAAPRVEPTYVVFTLAYAFITGLTYAGFSAFVLEAMGTGAAATKYSVYASLSNTPIYYMTLIDGWAHTRWGPSGMLHTEAAVGVVGLLAFLMVSAALPRRATARA